jgi:general secretion pathway protein A
MYNAYYGLTKKPFNMTPDPAFLFLTEQHREALAGLTYAILDRKGFLALSGMAGSGKTTLLSWVLQKLPRAQVQSSVILNPTLTRDEFLEMAMLDFGISDIPASKAHRLWILQKFLVKGKEEGRVSVLVIDEAHKLSSELLEEIRLLGNFECAEEKLLQVVLIGQSELDDILNRPDLWQFKQRISVRLSLQPLGADEVQHYIQHRWRVAGGQNGSPFSPDAIKNIAKWSQGIPRLINSICDSALISGFADVATSVTGEHIESAARDLRLIDKPEVAPLPAPHVPVAIPEPPAPARPAPAPTTRSTTMKTLDRRAARSAKPSFFNRWASKFGLA